MEEITDSVIPEKEEDYYLLIYCMLEGENDILSKRKDEVYYSSLVGRY